MLPHPLTNFEIQKYYENESTFNGVYSRNNLPKIIHGAYIINLDEYESVETHWIALYANDNNVTYFDIALEFNILQKKLENSLEIKICQRFIEYKHMIQQCVDTLLDSLVLCCKEKVYRIIQTDFLLMIMKRMIK